MRRIFLTSMVVGLMAALSMTAFEIDLAAQTQTKFRATTSPNPLPRIKPSRLMENLRKQMETHPNITKKQLADLGNELMKRKGFNYEFEMCEIIKVNKHAKMIRRDSLVTMLYTYRLNLTDGEKQCFQFVSEDSESLCGECVLSIPCLSVSKDEMTILASGKEYQVQRAPSFKLSQLPPPEAVACRSLP